MPACIGENVLVTFTCPCCRQSVTIWSFVPEHPDTSNTDLLPEKWRRRYRQDWYMNPDGNHAFDQGQLFQLEYVDGQPILTAVELMADDNPYVAGLERIPEEGIGSNRIVWVCHTCNDSASTDPVYLWRPLLALAPPQLSP